MAQDKRVFTGGMDKDSDPRIIKDGDYRDALNIRNMASMDGTSGSVENIEGNTLVPFQFIDETDQILEFTSSDDGHIQIEEVPVSTVIHTQKIYIGGTKETPTARYNFGIFYMSASYDDDGNAIEFGFPPVQGPIVYLVGREDKTGIASDLLTRFSEGGPLHSLTVDNLLTGQPLNIKVSSIVDGSGQPLTESNNFDNTKSFVITYEAATTNAPFALTFKSSGSQVSGQFWGETITPELPLGSLWLSNQLYNGAQLGGTVVLGSENSFHASLNSSDDAENNYGPGDTDSNSGATWDLEVGGEEPSNPSITPTNNVNIYSVNDLGNGNFDVQEFLNLDTKTTETGSGSQFQFDSNQHQLSNMLDAIVKTVDNGGGVNPVLVTGGGGMVSSLSNVSKNFTTNTPLAGRKRSIQGTVNADTKSYNQLEYYYDSEEIVEQAGFSIDKGTITFAGTDIIADELYLLKAPLLAGKSHKLTYTVAGLPSGNSFTFNVLDIQAVGTDSNGLKSSFIDTSFNYSLIGIKFKNTFSSSDSMTITNLRLFLEKTEVSSLAMRFQTSLSIDFNLAFAKNSEELLQKLKDGEDVTQVPEWYPGTSLRLTKVSVGDQDDIDITSHFEYTNLQDQLAVVNAQIGNLETQIKDDEIAHGEALITLNAQLATNTASATAELSIANALNSTLQSEVDKLQNTLSGLEDIIIGIDDPDSDANITNLIDSYQSSKDDVNQALTNIVSNLQALDSSIISNAQLQEELDKLTQDLLNSQQQVVSLQATIDSKDREIIELNTTVAGLQQTVAVNATKIEGLEQQLSSLVSENNASESQINELTIFNKQLAELLENQQNLNAVQAETINNLTKDLIDANQIIADQAATITQQNGEEASLNDIISRLRLDIEKLEEELSTQTSALSNQEDLTAQLEDTNKELERRLREAEDRIIELEQSQAETLANLASLQLDFNGLKLDYTSLEEDFTLLSKTYEGLVDQINDITQANIDATDLAAVSNTDIQNIISEYSQLNNPVVLTEKLSNGEFISPVTQWSGDNWVFENGRARSNKVDLGESGLLSQSVDLGQGLYVLVVNTLELKECSLVVDFLLDNGTTTSQGFTITDTGLFSRVVNLQSPCKSIRIRVVGSGDYIADIEKISLNTFEDNNTVTSNLILELLGYVNQLKARNENLSQRVLDQQTTIDGLSVELKQAQEDITLYNQAFSISNKNILALSELIIDVIEDFGVSSTVTSSDITNFINDFNANQNNVQEQISLQNTFVNNLHSLLSEVDGGSVPSSVNNEKWLLSFSGGLPVISGKTPSDFYSNIPPSYIVIKNSNIPDLQPKNINLDSSGGFLNNPGFQVLDGSSVTSLFRRGFVGGVDGNNIFSSKHPEQIIVSDLNRLTNNLNYNDTLNSNIDGKFYIGNPNTFYVTFYSPSTGKNYTIKFTLLNLNPASSLVDTNGDSYKSSSSGDKIIGDRGGQRPIVEKTSYLEGQGIDDGLQVEVEFLGGETGWNIYYNTGPDLTSDLQLIPSLNTVDIYKNNTYNWNWNVDNTKDPNNVTDGGANFQLHVEQIQQGPSNKTVKSAVDSVESFVEALVLPSYDGQNLNSDEYIYPSGSSDIIMNKSQDVTENLPFDILGARRMTKNNI